MLDQTLSWALVARNGALTIIIAALTVSQLWSNSMALRAQPLGKRQR
jgi:hypothetical protein